MMHIASYKGKSRFFNRLCSWWLRGNYSHTELVLGYDAAGLAICVSSSFMDGGVRVKHMRLNPEHWDLVPVAGRVEDAWAWVREYAVHLMTGWACWASSPACWATTKRALSARRPWPQCSAFRIHGVLTLAHYTQHFLETNRLKPVFLRLRRDERMCKLTSKMRVGYALCGTGSGGAIVAGTPQAAAAAQANGAVAFGLGWNEVGIIAGALVGLAGLIFSQYWAWQRDQRERQLHEVQLKALQGGCDVER